MITDTYIARKAKGKYDLRNTLNDLTGKEWLQLCSSFWISEKCFLDKEAFKHPAPFLVKDIQKLISLFTKKSMVVLDPFCGSGTTLIASALENRFGIGFDISEEYRQLAVNRLQSINATDSYIYKIGNNIDLLNTLELNSIDYIVTSPPYFNILKNNSKGLRADKSIKGFRNGARCGVVSYPNVENNLEYCNNYKSYIDALSKIFSKCKTVLKEKRYLSIIISDFTVNKKEVNVTGNVIDMMISLGFEFAGNVTLVQNNKPLYPFGYPYAYKINHHNQNILHFRNIY